MRNPLQDSVVKQHQFKHPIQQVWNAISVASEISTWFIQADFEARVGYRYTFRHEETVITGEVLTANPVHELVYTWVISGTEAVTTVSWNLEEHDGGTLLTLEHSGISRYPGDTAVVMFENFSSGWAICFRDLEKYLLNT